MPIGATTTAALLRAGLASTYLVLALLLSPMLLQHELALPSDSHHSDSDLCSWLDHVAGNLLQSASTDVTVALLVDSVDTAYHAPLRSTVLFSDPSRGPPVLI